MSGDTHWTKEDLEETLYQRDPDPSARIINEFKYLSPVRPTNTTTTDTNAITKSKGEGVDQENKKELDHEKNLEEEEPPPALLDLDLSGDQVQIVEFYAPW